MTDDTRTFATVTIEGPGRNLLNPDVLGKLEADLKAADADDNVAGIILTGAGDVFCGGLDVPAIKAGADPVPFYQGLVGVLRLLPLLTKPLVAVLNGDALAGGAGFVAAADYVVSVPTAKVGSFEVSVNVWPVVAQVGIVKRIGARAAAENILSGEPFTAERAKEVGLINVIAEPGDAIAKAEEFLEKTKRGRDVMAVGRPSVYALDDLSYDEALEVALSNIEKAYAK